jgi:tetratricopeptide (TPR) repeat protein
MLSSTAGPSTALGRGQVFRFKGEHEKALAEYDRAIAINPKHAAAYA